VLQDINFSFPEQNDSLYQLACNYRNSLNDLNAREGTNDSHPAQFDESRTPVLPGFLSRDSSLIDLAMIPTVEDTAAPLASTMSDPNDDDAGLSFVDFPNPEVNPDDMQLGRIE